MNAELDNLIEMALADGVVTEKEREIILRKADKLGEDIDEVEMILEGKISLMMKEQNIIQQKDKTESQKEGNIKKCPSCGAPTESFSTKCKDCGYEFRNTESSTYTTKIMNLLELASEKSLIKREENTFNKLLSFIHQETPEKKMMIAQTSIISTFPVPNTKEDILEFLSLSISQVNSIEIDFMTKLHGTSGIMGYKITHKNAWLSLANKAIMKARFSMKDDKKTLEEIESYAKQLKIK